MLFGSAPRAAAWEVTFHDAKQLQCDGRRLFLQWKRGKHRERRGTTKPVVVRNGTAAWEEVARFPGTVKVRHDEVQPKRMKLRLFQMKDDGTVGRLGGIEIDIAPYIKLGKGLLQPHEQSVKVAIPLKDSECSLTMTVRTSDPAAPTTSAAPVVEEALQPRTSDDIDETLSGPSTPISRKKSAPKDDEARQLREELRRQKQEHAQAMFAQSAVLLVTPAYVGGVPVTSIMVYEALHRWRFFSSGTADADATLCLISKHLSNVAVKRQDCLYYWLSTAVHLFHLTYQEFPFFKFDSEEVNEVSSMVLAKRNERPGTGPNGPDAQALKFECEMHHVATALYRELVATCQKALPTELLVQTLFNVDCTPEMSAIAPSVEDRHSEDIVAVLEGFVAHLQANGIPSELQGQFCLQLALYIRSVALQSLLSLPKLCSTDCGLALKLQIASLMAWADHRGLKTGNPLQQLKDVANVLIMHQKETLKDICLSLPSEILDQLLDNYRHQDDGPRAETPEGRPAKTGGRLRAWRGRDDTAGISTPKAAKNNPCLVMAPSLWSTHAELKAPHSSDGQLRRTATLLNDADQFPAELRNDPYLTFLFP